MNPASRVTPQRLTQLPRPGVNHAYVRFVRRQPCCVSGQTWNIEAAHTGPRGLGTKANDLDCIPLARQFHQFGPNSYHVLGRTRFERFHKISIPDVIRELQAKAVSEGVNLEPAPRKPMGFQAGRGRKNWRRA